MTSIQQTLKLGQPVWMRDSTGRKRRYFTLSGHHETSVAIVGGGMTGALVAHAFASAGVATRLLEAGVVAQGSTAPSSALLLEAPDLELGQLEDRYGVHAGRRIWRVSHESVRQLIALIKRLRIREREAKGNESNLPPGSPFLDIVGTVERADDGDERRGTTPQGAGNAERQQSAVPVVGGRRICSWISSRTSRESNEPMERPTSSVMLESGKKLATASRNRMAGRAEKELVRQLRRQPECVVVDSLAPRATGQFSPRERYRLEHAMAKRKC